MPDVSAARAIASAFLAGAWRPRAMTARAASALGERPEWLAPLARATAAFFPRPPHDMRDALAAFVSQQPAFADAGRVPVVRWFTPAPEMGLLRYRYQWVPKRGGGSRLLEAPRPRLRAVQRRILDEILARIPPHDAAHGFVPGRSPLTHAALHVGRAFVLRCDLRAFFADVPTPRAAAVFRHAGYPEEVARTLVALCSNRASLRVLAAAPRPTAEEIDARWRLRRRLAGPHLPQGAPTSPALANLCAHRLDVRLAALAAAAGATYSRYADDLTFSSDGILAASFVRAVDAIARDQGFALNPAKTRLMRAAQRQQVTGLVVNRRLNVTRRDYDELRAILSNCARRGPAAEARGADVARWREQLRGRIAWVGQSNPARGARLGALFAAIAW